jgi:hypothetical protein
MIKSVNPQLINLLEHQRNNNNNSVWVDELPNLFEGINIIIPLKQALDIYTVRSRINAHKSGRITGYNTLLPTLEQTNVSNVRIIKLIAEARIYLVFTDEDYSLLFGVLNIPKKQKD